MNKKRYFVLGPAYLTKEKRDELNRKAALYYGEKDYEDVMMGEDIDALFGYIVNKILDNEVSTMNSGLLSIALNILAMSQADSIYISKDFSSDKSSNLCTLLAVVYGVDVVYESI